MRWIALALVGLVIVMLLDGVLFRNVRSPELARLEGKDWYRLLRIMGYLPTWVVVGVALMLHDRARRGPARGLLVIGGAVLGGVVAEVAKLVLVRQRPINNGVADGAYVWGTPLESLWRHAGNYGLPSSHAAVAFAGAFVLGWLFPRARGVFWLLAAGCGFTRLLAGAHFTSDVYVAACLSYALCAWLLGNAALATRGRA